MTDEREPYQVNAEQYDSFHEESIRERVDTPREGGPEGPFPQADVEYLLNIIDELRREPQALVTEEPLGYQRIGPDFDAWADKGLFAGRSLLLPDGSTLKMHVCVLPGPDFMWYVPLPSDHDELKRCLLDLALHERIDLRPRPVTVAEAARRILDAGLPSFEPRVRIWLEALAAADQPES